MPANVLTIVHEQATRIASNNSQTLSLGLVIGILVSLWSAMSGVKAVIDALNVIYEQRESRSFIKLNVMALVFTLFGFAAFLLAMAAIVVLPLVLSPIGFGNLTETIARVARWPVLLLVLLFGLAILYRYCPDRRAARWQWVSVGSVFCNADLVCPFVSILLVPSQLRQLQCYLRLARRGRRSHDLVVDIDYRCAARCRTQCRD